MNILEAFVAHYRDHERQSAAVPEIRVGDAPLTVYWKLLTPALRDDLFKRGVPDDVAVVVRMAEDESGAPLFQKGDGQQLKRAASAALVGRLARLMLGIKEISEEAVSEAEKN